MPRIYRQFRVEGRVQGVGFRWWTRKQAEALGIVGSVRNLPDGSVEVIAGGSPQELDQLQKRLLEGPPTSHVTRVIAAVSVSSGATDFLIE